MMTLTNNFRRTLAMGLTLAALLAVLMSASLSMAAKPALASTTFTVTNTSEPGDGLCNAAGCTLRDAILAANDTPGADTINFNIPDNPNAPGLEVKTISPKSVLPPITDQVTIDGYTQPGASINT